MGYYDEMKEVRKALRKEMIKAGIKNISIKGGKGTAYDWTEINPKTNKWTEQDLFKLKQFGIQNKFGDVERSYQVKAMLYGHQARKFKQTSKYKKLKEDFSTCALKEIDQGTCVLGAGTMVMKKGKPIDFWRQHGQGEHRDWVAQKIMQNRAKELGLEFKHEGGTMD